MRSRKILPWLIFSIALLLTAGEKGNDEFLYFHTASFNFHDGVPFIRVHVKDLPAPLAVSGAVRFSCGGKDLSADAATVTLTGYTAPVVRYRVAIEELTGAALSGYRDRVAQVAAETNRPVELFMTGGIFSISERRIDNREYYIVLKELFDKEAAVKLQDALRAELPGRQILALPFFVSPSQATITVEGTGKKLTCDRFVKLEPTGPATAGDLTLGGHAAQFLYGSADGTLGLVVEEDVEKLLYRILPGEMFASAPAETLKAQAIAARTDIFMQLGKRHIGDPVHICSEVHCQKLDWKNDTVAPKFRDAVDATRGEILLHKDLYVARAPYSSSCGGHSENIKNVWFSAEKDYLQGVWDSDKPQKFNLTRGVEVRKFLEDGTGECGIALNKKFRWRKDIPAKKMDELLTSLGVGHVTDIKPLERGVSGRVWKLLITGDTGEKPVWGELVMRRLIDDLPSSLFAVDYDEKKKVWKFTGAGWGHGVGMCQMGAIGLGQKGKKYREILGRYYPGTSVTKIY
ncbi:MAG TPA: SpoIID/LytB domain-containing protein [bacterium]|nr:SpoIID/LytB domain-containing protein [bacterium]